MVTPYEVPWRNNPMEQYGQFCRPSELQNLNQKLFRLVHKYGEAFDDNWWYYYNRKMTWIKKVPIWLNQKRVPREKPKKYERNRKLEVFI